MDGSLLVLHIIIFFLDNLKSCDNQEMKCEREGVRKSVGFRYVISI